ncbi:hypothetical protein COTS27_00874 [Spirochaetota bacterium]|nr:hypothetical protein COTS27_00874 [Spirochaetota bacterium]
MSQNKQNFHNHNKNDYDDINDEDGGEDMNSIIPYDIDKQISRMEEVLHYDAEISKLFLAKETDETDKSTTAKTISVDKFWEQIIKLKLCLCLTVKQSYVELQYNEAMILRNSLLEHAREKVKVPILARKGNAFYNTNKNDEVEAAPDNLNGKILAGVFSEGIFDFKVTSVAVNAAGDEKPSALQPRNVSDPASTAAIDEVFKFSKNGNAVHICGYRLQLMISTAIEKYVLLRRTGLSGFSKEREEQSTAVDSTFTLMLSEPGSYLLSCYKRLNDDTEGISASDDPSNEPSNNIRQYLFLLKKSSLYITELPFVITQPSGT